MKRLFLATILSTLAILSGGKAMAQFFAGGSGTQNDPYLIATAEQFNKMGEEQYSSKYYKQTADLTFTYNLFNASKNFKAINFSGYYDGQGFSIKSNGEQNKTLFNEISGGEVKNLVIDGVTISIDATSSTSIGGLCSNQSGGLIYGITVKNCNFTKHGAASEEKLCGGVVGKMTDGKISNCNVSNTYIKGYVTAGGVVARMDGGSVEYCAFTGTEVKGYSSLVGTLNSVGGIVGKINKGNVSGCYASGNVHRDGVSTSESVIGGIAAHQNNEPLDEHTNISNCYNGTNVPEAVSSNLQSDTSNVISGVNGNLDTIVAVLNSGLNPPAFVVENGEIVHTTAATPANFTANDVYESIDAGGRFELAATWNRTGDADGPKYIIRSSTSVSIEPGVTLPDNVKIEIKNGGNLINKTGNAIIARVEHDISQGWNCMGFPIKGESNLAPLAASDAPDIWALAFDYNTNKWSETFLHYYNEGQKDKIQAGNGIMAFVDTTKYTYTYNVIGETVNSSLTVTNNVTGSNETGRWMSLANPYPAAIDPSAVVNSASVQGQLLYIYMPGKTFGNRWYSHIDPALPIDAIIAGSGFMVNMPDGRNSFTFDKSMIKGYANSNTPAAKSAVAKREFLTVSVSTNGYKVPVMFAKNEAAREDYDIFDANKLFGDGSVAEPYLVCNGINLCKEEVNTLPYTATMNIKSGEAQSVEIIAENIPEGYSLVLLDGEEEIAMNQGDIYTVNIASGENADRFKLKIGEKNVSITDVEKVADLSIRNNNRNIIIEGGKNIRAEVYNTLGQKVYETTARNFNIEGVAAGAYVIKVQSGKAVQSQKVIIR